MYRGKYTTHKKLSVGNALSRTVGILLALTIFSVWLVCGMFAKYTTTGENSDSARVAVGAQKVELREHAAFDASGYPDADGGEYRLDLMTEVKKNTYAKVLPGVDIPKDPFIRMDLSNAEVSYELYVKVIQSEPFPDGVTYELTDQWDETETPGVYRYKKYFEAGKSYSYTGKNVIPILKNNKIYVSEHYVGSGTFTLTFEAFLKQAH